MAKSPQTVLTERSAGTYSVTTSDTILAVVGYATKGPIGEVTSVISKPEFVEKFGPVSQLAPWSSLAVYRAFNQGNKILFNRVEDGTATGAERAITNSIDSANAYQEFTATSPISGYVNKSIYDFKITADGGAQRNVFITSPESGDWELSDIASQINSQLGDTFGFIEFENTAPDPITAGDYSFKIVIDGTAANSGNDISVTLAVDDTLSEIAAKIDTVISGDGASASVDSVTGKIRIKSDSTGSSSTILFTAPDAGNDIVDVIGDVNVVADGEDSNLASSALNSDTSKVRITSGNATVTNSDIDIAEGTTSGAEHLVALLGLDPAVTYVEEVNESTTDNILLKAIEKGSATNNIAVVKSSRINPVDDSTIHKVDVYYDNELKESFDNVSLTVGDSNFFATLINADVLNSGSKWINIDYEANDAAPIEFPNGTYKLGVGEAGETEFTNGATIGEYDYKVGTDGIPSSNVQTSNSTAFVTALDTSGDLGNTEAYDYHILVTPDNGSEVVQGAAITLAEYRKDFIYVADPPQSLTYSQVVDWHNGKSNLGRNSVLNTSYGCTYWSWLKDYDSDNGEYVWCPPSVFIPEKFMEIDRLYGPWATVAGDSRGKVVAYDYEKTPSLAQREVLYGDLNAVNPFVFFDNKGIEIYGDKTLLRENKAQNRIHIQRMLIYAKKLIKKAMDGMIFEPHLETSWNRAVNLINSILEPIRQAGGIDDYKVIIDTTTNTPDVIAQSLMKGIIQIVPVGSIEIIDLSITLYNPGATIE